MGDSFIMGMEFQFGKMKKMDDDGCRTRRANLMSLNYTLKKDKFYVLHILPQLFLISLKSLYLEAQ